MAGVSTFLGLSLYKSHLKISALSAKIEELETKPNSSEPTTITQTIADQDEQISWETFYQNNELLLQIQGINKSELELDKICVLSVTTIENKDTEHEFYLSGDKRIDKNDCQQPSIVIPQEDGNWELEYSFTDQKSRTIRVEKIYHNNGTSKSYIDFTIGKSDQQD